MPFEASAKKGDPLTERDIAVVVLAGGEGRRMGGGKPLALLDGRPLIEHALALARQWSPRVAVAVRSAEQVGPVDAPLLFDDPAIGGPAAGLTAAFAWAQAEGALLLLTLPCDAPRLPADLLQRLAAALGPEDGVAMARSGGALHPVCALWRTAMSARLGPYLATGRRSVRGFGEACGLTAVEWPTDAGDPFAGANTPEELDALRR